MTDRSKFLNDLGASVTAEVVRLFCGELLGSGIGRTTFVLRTDETKVIKIEDGAGSFQNTMEWKVWEQAQDKSAVSRWLAPCRWISESGSVLIMDRTEPAPKAKLPERMPRWLGDFKPDNYGLLNGRLVCHDYGLTKFRVGGKTTYKAGW